MPGLGWGSLYQGLTGCRYPEEVLNPDKHSLLRPMCCLSCAPVIFLWGGLVLSNNASEESKSYLFRDALAFHLSFDEVPNAKFAAGDPKGEFSSISFGYQQYLEPGIHRQGLLFRSKNVLRFKTKGNLNREAGTILLWARPLFDWRCRSGGILFDARFDLGAMVPDDPSQRMALVYTHEKGRAWRFYVSVDRNIYRVGTKQKRDRKKNPRSRFYVGSGPQHFEAGEWMHLAVAWENDRAWVYKNGLLEGENLLADGVLPNLPQYFQLGAVESGMGNNAMSVLDEFFIYNRALKEDEIRAFYASYNHTVAEEDEPDDAQATLLFKLDFSGGIKVACKGESKPVEVVGMDEGNLLETVVGHGMGFGEKQFLRFRSEGNIRPGAGTIAFWVISEFDELSKKQVFFELGSPNKVVDEGLLSIQYPLYRRNFGCILTPSMRDLAIEGAKPLKLAQRFCGAAYRFEKGTPFHIALTWDSHYGRFYVDGRMEGRVRLNDGPPTPLPETFKVGNPRGKTSAILSDLRIYDLPLTPKRIQKMAKRR